MSTGSAFSCHNILELIFLSSREALGFSNALQHPGSSDESYVC